MVDETADLGGRVTAAITTRRAELERLSDALRYERGAVPLLESVGRERAMLDGITEAFPFLAEVARVARARGEEIIANSIESALNDLATGLGLEP